jgi:hypothetical protein
MSTNAPTARGADQPRPIDRRDSAIKDHGRRLSTETKSAFKTTEMVAYVVVLVGLLIAGAVTKASQYGANHDAFRADRVWLYATILTIGYMVSRGLAKAGSRQPYDERS